MLARETCARTSSWVTASSGSTGMMSSTVIDRGRDLSISLAMGKGNNVKGSDYVSYLGHCGSSKGKWGDFPQVKRPAHVILYIIGPTA
jgi:hypothetical protein